jgi:ABC-type lipoprotein release transport system permease subunit
VRRARALLAYALGGLARRRGRNAAITVGLAVVTATFATVLFASEGLRAMQQELAQVAPSLTVQRLVAGRPALFPVSDVARVSAHPSVRSARARVWGYLYLSALEGNVTVIAIDDAGTLGLDALDALSAGEAILGSGVARSLGLRVGDRVAMATEAVEEPGGLPSPIFLTVRAVLPPETALLANDVVLTTDAEARRLLGVPEGEAVDVAVDVFPPEESTVVAAAISHELPGVRVIERESLARTFELTNDTRAGLLSATLVPALIAFLLLAWERLSGLGPEERREIGVLKAVGWSTSDVLSARMTETGLVALLGTTLGLVLAYVHAFVLGAPLLVPALLGWSNLRPSLVIPPSTDPMELVALVAAVVVPFVGIAIVPAWRAAMIDPDRALR